MLAHRGVLSGHFSANHLRRGSRRDDGSGGGDFSVSTVPPTSAAAGAACNNNGKATDSQVCAMSNSFAPAGDDDYVSREVSHKRSRSPSIHQTPIVETAPRHSTPASPHRAGLTETLKEECAHLTSRAARRLSSHTAASHVTRNVFYPPPAELAVASPQTSANPVPPPLLESAPHIASANFPSAVAHDYCGEFATPGVREHGLLAVPPASHRPMARQEVSPSESIPYTTDFHTRESEMAPISREGQIADAGGSNSPPRASAEAETASSWGTTSQPRTCFLSALAHQQREQQMHVSAFTPAALSNSPYTEPSLPSLSAFSHVAPTPPAASSRLLLPLPPPQPLQLRQEMPSHEHSAASPRPPQQKLDFSQVSSSRERSLLPNSPGASPPLSPAIPITAARETTAVRSAGGGRGIGPVAKEGDLEVPTAADFNAATEAVPHQGGVEPPRPSIPPRFLHTATTTASISFCSEKKDASAPCSFTDARSRNDVGVSAAGVGLVLPAAEDEPPESDEALQREIEEDWRLSMDVAFTPSGAGSGAPPVFSQSSLLHEEEEREVREGNGGDGGEVGLGVGHETKRSTVAVDSSLPGSTAVHGTDAAVGLHSRADIAFVGPPLPPSPHASSSKNADTPVMDLFSELAFNSSSTGAADPAYLPPPQQSPSSWPILAGPLPYVPAPLTKDKGEKPLLAVAAAGSSAGGGRHRTVFSFSSRTAATVASVPLAESPPSASCPCSEKEENGHADRIPTSSATPTSHPGEDVAPLVDADLRERAVVLPTLLGVPLPDSENTEGLVETCASEMPARGEAAHETPATAPDTSAGPTAPAAAAASMEDGGHASTLGSVSGGAPPPPPPQTVADAPPVSTSANAFTTPPPPPFLPSAKATFAQVGTSPLRLLPSTTAPLRPARTCFTLHFGPSAASTTTAAQSTYTNPPATMDSSSSNGITLPLSQSADVAPLTSSSATTTSVAESFVVTGLVPAVASAAPARLPLCASAPRRENARLPTPPTCETFPPATAPSDVVRHLPYRLPSDLPATDLAQLHGCAAPPQEGNAAAGFDAENSGANTEESHTEHSLPLPDPLPRNRIIIGRDAGPLHPSPLHPPAATTECSLTNSPSTTNVQNNSYTNTTGMPGDEEHSSAAQSAHLRGLSIPLLRSAPPVDLFYDLPRSVGDFYAARRGVRQLYDWQHELLSEPEVRRGRSFIYSLPTSGGKTLVAELSLLRCVLNRRQSCFLVLPFVSLAEEKTLALEPLAALFDFRVDGHYGSSGRFPLCEAPAMYVCTIEKANSLLNYMLEEGRTAEIGAVVVDEIHMVGESRRGATLELFLSKLLMIDEARQMQRAEAQQQHHVSDQHGTTTCAVTPAEAWTENAGTAYDAEDDGVEMTEQQERGQQAGEEPFADPGPLQIIGMSATVPNLSTIAKWLHAACFERDFRPVPLRAYSVVGGLVLRDGQRNERNLSGSSVQQHLLELATEEPDASVLVFCASRQQCVDTAKGIVGFMRAQAIAGQQLPSLPGSSLPPAAPPFSVLGVPFPDVTTKSAVFSVPAQGSLAMKSLLADLAALAHYEASQLSEIVPHGVAFHHGGLLAEERELIEAAFRRKHIRILCSTSTLAAGVNLPARRVIIKTPYVGRDFLTKARYLQMCGRAGRAGLDPYGESYLLLSKRDQSRGHALMRAAVERCCSQILEDDQTLTRSLLECVGVGLVTDSASARRWSSSLLSTHAVGPVDGVWRKHVAAASFQDGVGGITCVPTAPSAAFADSAAGTVAHQTVSTTDEESEGSRSVPVPAPSTLSTPLTAVPVAALESMVCASLDTLARCGLVSVTQAHAADDEEYAEGEGIGGKGAVVDAAHCTSAASAVGEGRNRDVQVRVTPFGSSSVRSCFSVEEALLLREELDELRHTGLILSDDLHLCYFLTPLREVGTCDWELLRLMMSRMSDSRQRIASLLGVDPYFIDQQAMGLGGPMQATEEGRRRLFTAKRFYVALMLADVLAEVPMATVEQQYNVNRGQLQNLMRSASMFSSSITSFCHAMEWYSLEAVLSSFVKRLGFGVKPDLLPLMEMRNMQPPRARALWNAGFKKLSLIAAADADDMVAKVKQMNPPEMMSAKFFTKRSALMVIREAHLTLQSQIKEKKGELQELVLRGRATR
ncbi:putative DNA polymerase theta (helicase domain only) [Leptomonas pyrrhocoris]|uniref:Putative DNA polymerase theta (Helicase domain only) n=1 Tax=Leptomonas pyrrhocoris TaxID=157538 RepID=A0A0M9G7C4_LEPPY|nr:putative DNA polymerase theta (helicase domain only) [Leptomonas pyrrhocoris]XP_015662276.1 putative DNA polymerase theta (helicase domain only) [Leptomonas pyrrhocoris]KPA83836.1 putative DNA polymerase theta (helicase domain only) [Leptomonas pyrrhocoris]KPA83837.1 putative DNA polymerase theta (helicase domain only) [Leptomonas pyrrhocoris]|eukprot:XP_015662275.1 putative DNA polymerase theta (helicase domain only) [Leptomonas pyrrhocoris]